MTNIQFNPVIPIWLVGLLLLAAGLGAWISLARCNLAPRHRWTVFGLRLAGLALLASLLLLPERIAVNQKDEAPTLAVLIDASASMTDSPADTADARIKRLRGVLASRAFSSLASRYQIRWYEFGADLEDGGDPASGHVTDFNAPRSHLHRALNTLQLRNRGANLAGVLLLTDGLDQSEEPLSPEATRVPVLIPDLEPPIAASAAGAATEVWIDEVNAPKLLVVHWKGQVDVVLKRTPAEAKLPVTVNLYQGAERVRTSYVVFEPGETTRALSFGIEPLDVGRLTWRVEIEPGSDTRLDNNNRTFLIDVTDPQNRVLYLEGTLRYEFKFLKRALLKEKNFQLSAFVQSTPGVFINFSEGAAGGGSSSTSGLPDLTDEDTVQYRAIVLGEMAANSLTEAQQKAIQSFVDKGGGLLFLGGAKAYGPDGWPASPIMAKLLPFTGQPGTKMNEGHFSVTVEALGRGHAVLTGIDTDGAYPPVLSIWGPVEKQPAATPLLAVADGSPLLLVSRYGKGKVAAVLSDSLWRWQLGAAQLDDTKGLYDQFFSQLTYWLAPQEKAVDDKPDLQVVTAAGTVELRKAVVVGAVMGDHAESPQGQTLNAIIVTPDGRELRQTMSPAKLADDVGLTTPVWGWRTEFVPHIPGAYSITVTPATGSESATAKVLVEEPQLELTHAPLNRPYLQRLADRTNGKFFDPKDLDEAARALPWQPLRLRTTEQTPLWNSPWVLIILLSLFVGEWYFRSKHDLV